MKFIFTALNIIFCTALFAQQFSYVPQLMQSNTVKQNNFFNNGVVVSADSMGVIVLKKNRNEFNKAYYFDRFTPDLEYDKVVEYQLWQNRKTYILEHFVEHNDSVYLFLSNSNNWLTTKDLVVQTLDKKTLKTGEIRILKSEGKIKSYLPDYFFARSDDRSKLMICSYRKFGNKSILLDIDVYNQKMDLLWRKQQSIEGFGRNTEITDYKVDNKGNVFILSLLYENNLFTLNAEIKNEYGLMCIDSSGNKTIAQRYHIEDKYIRTPHITPDNKGNVALIGLYSEIIGEHFSKGLFVAMYSPHFNTFTINKKTEFEQDLRNQLMNRKRNFGETEIYGYQLDEIIFRKDNTALLIFEQRYSETHTDYKLDTYTNEQVPVKEIKWFYKNLLFVYLDAEGNLLWTKQIDNNLSSDDNDIIPSYRSIHIPNIDKVYVCYYHYPTKEGDYANTKQKQGFFKRKYASMYITEVKNDGTLENRQLLLNKKKQPLPNHLNGYDNKNGTFAMFGLHPYLHKGCKAYKIWLKEIIIGVE